MPGTDRKLMIAEYLSEAFLSSLQRRREQADSWNRNLRNVSPTRLQRMRWTLRALRHHRLSEDLLTYGKDKTVQDRVSTFEEEWRSRSGRRSASIPWALNDVVSGFWAGGECLSTFLSDKSGLFKVAGDAAQMMSPLLVKALIRFSQEGESRLLGMPADV
jgi:ATP-binding cassette subfamily C (CFTR/MRP) protein 1